MTFSISQELGVIMKGSRKKEKENKRCCKKEIGLEKNPKALQNRNVRLRKWEDLGNMHEPFR